MSEAPVDGLEALANRVERAKRTVPPPRHPRGAQEAAPKVKSDPVESPSPTAAPSRRPPGPSAKPAAGSLEALLTALSDAPTVMLGARVRVPLDDMLSDLVHEARHHQVKTSKVELVELALLSLVGVDGATIADRVREFRSQSGRYLVLRR
jgi:hypothetical protein